MKIKELLTKISEALEILYFTAQDIEFLKEYKICTDTISYCLNVLQGEKEIFFGDISSFWIFRVKNNFKNIKRLDENDVEH